MSWISKNYEKAVLGAAVLVAGGLVFAGWQKLGSVHEDFSAVPKGSGPNQPAIKDADVVSTAKSSFQLRREWTKGDDNGRPVDLFTGIALFVNKRDQRNPVDFFKGDPVHPPIPNSWWIENRIDPGFGDSPQRDADEDGFSNLEEFTAQTDPNNSSDYPSLISKLVYINDESVEWVLRPGYESQGKFPFKYGDGKTSNKIGAADPVAPGEIFFDKEPAKGRFKLIGSEKKMEMNDATKSEQEVTIVKVEDQKPNKNRVVYEIPANFRPSDARKFSHFDRTAVLSLDALGLSGQEFKVEENTAFALPKDSKKKSYKVTEITPEHIGIEFTDKNGKVKTYEILKGQTGPATP